MSAFGWLLKREFWENRGAFLWAPLVTAGIFLILNGMGLALAAVSMGDMGFSISDLQDLFIDGLSDEELEFIGPAINLSLLSSLWLIWLVLFFVLFFYLLGALYDERKDRSILFWKSLPVSDTETVLSKVVTAMLVAPLLAFGAGVLMIFGFLGLLSLFLLGNDIDVIRVLWGPADPLLVILKALYVIPISAIWALPCIGWLLLCSAFARQKPFLWATAIPVGTGVIVSWFDAIGESAIDSFDVWTHLVGRLLLSVAPGSWYQFDELSAAEQITETSDAILRFTELASFATMSEPLLWLETWIGAAGGILMIAGAIYLRRWRDES